VRAVLALLVVAAAVIVVLLVLPRGNPSCAAGCAPQLSTKADAWVLPSLDGHGTVSLAEFRGKPLVVDFFASWCSACRDELPEFLAVSRRDIGVRFVGVDSEEYGDGAGMARQYGITAWPLARDVGGSDHDGLHEALTPAGGMPITALYDASGHLAQVRIGAETGAELAATLHRLFGLAAS
jgi:thiol-disulfide isomerase/thioredoxin